MKILKLYRVFVCLEKRRKKKIPRAETADPIYLIRV